LFGGQQARLDDGAKWYATGKPFEAKLSEYGD